MNNDRILDYAIDYVSDTLSSSVGDDGLYAGDDKVNKRNEAELCDLFEQVIGGGFFLVDEGEQLCVYSGTHFVRVDPDRLSYIIKKVMRRLGVGIVYQKNSCKMIADRCLENLYAEGTQLFDPDRRYVIFNNCVLNVETGEVTEHSMEYRSDLYLPFDYKPEVTGGLWERIVRETIPDDGMRKAFQQYCGAFLLDRRKYKLEYICLMVGSGRNGKSVVCKAIADMFGKDLVSSYSPEQLFRSSQSEYNLADIDGKVANYADDVSNKDFSGGDFKQFISGANFQARHIYGKPFTVTKVPLMLCCVNEVPPTTDDTNGYFRRLLPIICPNIIREEDVDVELPAKLATVGSRQCIFNWLYEGYKDLIAHGGVITVSESIGVVREEIKADSNSIRRWLRDCGERYGWISFKELMGEYLSACKEMGEPAKSPKSMVRVLKEITVRSEKRRDTTYYYFGEKPKLEVAEVKDDNDDEPVRREREDGELPF